VAPVMLSQADRAAASVDRELAARELAGLRRYLGRASLTPAQQAAALARQDELARIVDHLGTLLRADLPQRRSPRAANRVAQQAAERERRIAWAQASCVDSLELAAMCPDFNREMTRERGGDL
jgi:hypothetical protein